MSILLEVNDLKTQFRTERGLVKAVDGVSYHVNEREVVGIVGESGCGKSVTQLSVMQLIPNPPGEIVSGQTIFQGEDLLQHDARGPKMRSIRGGRISMIFQEPMTSLNPVMKISEQLIEQMTLFLDISRKEAMEKAIDLLDQVGIPDAKRRVDSYPHQFSGGMRQRVMIAMAISCEPNLVIADEPTTALDVTTQAQLLELMVDLVDRVGASLIIVTHNLGIVARFARRIYVMYAGRIVEGAPVEKLFAHPDHPYTRGLLGAVPRLDDQQRRRLYPIEGLPPNLINMPPSCAFLPRCYHRIDKCAVEPWPELKSTVEHHPVACYVDLSNEPTSVVPAPLIEATRPPAVAKDNDTVTDNGKHLVEVKNLKVYFPVTRGLLRRKIADVKAVDGISFSIKPGETLGLVGESGCGKTTTSHAILRLCEATDGQIIFNGVDITEMSERNMSSIRRKMSVIFQDPGGSLDPRQTAGSIVGEPLKVGNLVGNRAEYRERVDELFRLVGLDASLKSRVPHEFSGGQRQRLAVARALACEPQLIVLDEPISALDVSIQAQIINLLQDLQEQIPGLTYLLVAHDLSVVRHISDRVCVMYLGRIVEVADAKTLYDDPKHTYTKALLSAVPIPDPVVEKGRERIRLPGEVPSPLNPPPGCSFHPRCPSARDDCRLIVPELRDVGWGHAVACHRL